VASPPREPVRAPVGFVDAVTAAARAGRGYRRVAAAVFLPFSVKLPAEATAVVMVALLAVLRVRAHARAPGVGPDPARSPRGFPREDRTARAADVLTDRFARDSSSGERSPESKARPLEKEQDRPRGAGRAREDRRPTRRLRSRRPPPRRLPRGSTRPARGRAAAATAPAAPAAPHPARRRPPAKVEGALSEEPGRESAGAGSAERRELAWGAGRPLAWRPSGRLPPPTR